MSIYLYPNNGFTMLPFGQLIHRTVAVEWLIYHPGPAGASKGSRAALVDTVWYPVYSFTKIRKNNRAVPCRLPGGTLIRPSGSLTGYLRFDENAGRNGSSLFDTPVPVRVVKMVASPVKSEGSRPSTVRKWPKYPFLLTVGGSIVI